MKARGEGGWKRAGGRERVGAELFDQMYLGLMAVETCSNSLPNTPNAAWIFFFFL